MNQLAVIFNRKMLGLILSVSVSANFILLALLVNPVSASAGLELKWSKPLGQYAKTYIAPLAADLVGDGQLEIVVVGGTADYGSNGTVTVLNGTTGDVIWQVAPYSSGWGGVGSHSPFEIVDLDRDGMLEIVIASTRGAMALRGNDGSLYWINKAAPAEENYLAVADVDGNGYPEVFVSRGYGPYEGYDWTTSLTYDGKILNQAWTWHPCWGGLTIGDANFDGKFELYQGDRSNSYVGERNGTLDPYTGGGMGISAFDAETLTPLWNDPTILTSSAAPMLADVDQDGVLDIIVGNQNADGIAVLNSADGSVVTTGGKYRKGSTHTPVHSQPTVYDIDGDGNLEFISARESRPKIWDLYSWKLDATLPVMVIEPPKLGDVTGDGQMDIITVAGSTQDVFIYSYDSASRTYKEVEHLSDYRLVNANAFTLVQDIDGDGLNELVLTGGDGRVTAYDTPAPAPTPRARTTNQFYSEYRLGAAEYVAPPTSRSFNPPTHSNPILVSSSGTNASDENLIAKNQTTSDLDGDSVTNIYNWYADNTSLTSLLLPFDTRPTRTGTVLSDGFEYDFSGWDENGTTDWDRSTVQKHSGEYSAHAGDVSSYLTSDRIDASNAASITVSFWYHDHGIDDDDNIYLQFWNGSSDPTPYNNIFELGNTNSEDTWHHYSVWFRTILWYRISDFHVRIDARGIDTGEDLWVDDVTITLGDTWTTNDYSGYNNQGTIHGAVWKKNGVVGGAYDFNGASYIYVPHSKSLDGGASWTQITTEVWIKPTASKRGSIIIAKNVAGGYASYMMGFETSTKKPPNMLFWGVQNPTWKEIEYSTPLKTNTWYHVVGTYESGVGLTLHVNGAKVAESGFISGNIVASDPKSLYIGWDGATASKYFTGVIDDVRIYPRSLSSQQVSQRYMESRSGLSSSSTIVSQETAVGDIWKCEVTPSDSFLDGATRTSNTLTVLPPFKNSPPTINWFAPSDTTPKVNEGDSLEFKQVSSDPDGDILTYSWFIDASLQANTQNWTFYPSYSAAGLHDVKLVVSDGSLTASQEWFVTVVDVSTGVNRAPNIDTYSPLNITPEVKEEASLNFSHTSSDPDNDVLTYSWRLDSVQKATTQNWTYTPSYDEAGIHTVTLIVSDPAGLTDTQQWSVTVINVNRPPIINFHYPSTDPTIREGESQKFNVTKYDPDGDALSVSWFLNGNQGPETSDTYVFMAAFGSTGIYNVTVVVSDQSDQASHQWNLTVVVKEPLVMLSFNPLSDSTIKEAESQQFSVSYNDPNGYPLTAEWYLNSTLVGNDNSYTFEATYDSAGVYNVTVKVSNGLATHEWMLTVLNVNRPPIIESYTPVNSSPNVMEGATLNFTQASSDPDNDLLTYSWFLDGALQATTQNWTYSPSSDDTGPHNVTLAVSDPSGLFDSQQWEVTVGGARDFFFEFLTLFGVIVALYSLFHLIKLKPNKKNEGP